MTIYGWDSSHHDWVRGPMDMAAAVADGITFATHKIGEAQTYVDPRFGDWYRKARNANVPLLGAYYVNHPGDQTPQADRFLALLDAQAPGWRDGPFVLQVDAEKFDYMDRAPNKAEIIAFCARLVAKTGGRFRPVVYAPKWLYGDSLTGLGYPLWASSYGTNPDVHYRTAYPGDGSSRWQPYSGQTPAILQYGSRTRIGTQNTCDANAYRGTPTQLRNLVYPTLDTESDMPTVDEIWAHPLWDPIAQRTFEAGATLGHARNNTRLELAEQDRRISGRLDAILAAVQGLDTAAILTRIDQHAAAAVQRDAEDAARDTAIMALLEDHAAGNVDAAAVVEGIRALLHAATTPPPQG